MGDSQERCRRPDRVPWLIKRFVDKEAEFLTVTPESAGLKAAAMGFRKIYSERDLERLAAEESLDDALYAWCGTRASG